MYSGPKVLRDSAKLMSNYTKSKKNKNKTKQLPKTT